MLGHGSEVGSFICDELFEICGSEEVNCSECKNSNPAMFSEAAGGKKHLCLKCYHTFYKSGQSSRSHLQSRPKKPEVSKFTDVPESVYVEVKYIRERLDRLEEFCRNRGIMK